MFNKTHVENINDACALLCKNVVKHVFTICEHVSCIEKTLIYTAWYQSQYISVNKIQWSFTQWKMMKVSDYFGDFYQVCIFKKEIVEYLSSIVPKKKITCIYMYLFICIYRI